MIYPQRIGTSMCGKRNGGDCINFNNLYPECYVENPYFISDGECDGGSYNTTDCGYDGVNFN